MTTVSLMLWPQSLDLDGFARHNMSIARLAAEVAHRGESTIISGVDGRDPDPLQIDELTVDLELQVLGENDHTGTAHAVDEVTGVLENLLWLKENIGYSTPGETTRTATLTVGSRTFEAQVQVLNWRLARIDGVEAYVTYDLRIPAGVWAET